MYQKIYDRIDIFFFTSDSNSPMLTDIPDDFLCYLQVDLGQDMRVTALSTIGVRVKNASTGNYSFMYVSQYFLAYKRDGDKTWRRYHRNDVSLTVRIDWDSYSISFYSSYQSVSSENLEIHSANNHQTDEFRDSHHPSP